MKAVFGAMGGLLAFAAFASPARATPNFPGDIESHLGVNCPPGECGSSPPCTICHTTCGGGAGTATTPFGTNMRMFGLVKYQDNTLFSALDQEAAHNVSSAGDGISDVEKLKKCESPDAFLAGGDAGSDGAVVTNGATPPTLQYGCGGQIAGAAGAGEPAGAAGIVVLALAAAARRGRGRRR